MILGKYWCRRLKNMWKSVDGGNEEYLSIKQASEETGLAKERVKEFIRLKMIYVSKEGYIRRKDLDEFIITNLFYYPYSTTIAKSDSIKEYLESLQNKNQTKANAIIYINIPFCRSFCTFCIFIYLKNLFDKDKIQDYLQALKREIAFYSKTKYVRSKIFSSIYFGGGTPSCLSSKQLNELLQCCKDSFNISKDAGVTVEGTPATFSASKMEALYKNGVKRLSFGVQTFNNEIGKILNLPQGSERVFKIVKLARYIGFRHLNIDLIFNLPGQSMTDYLIDLKKAIELKLESITNYPLGVSPYTELYRQLKSKEIPMVNLSFSDLLRAKLAAHKLLNNAGYSYDYYLAGHYNLRENYNKNQDIKDERLCAMSGYGEILGLGAGANGFLNNHSYVNTESLSKYIEKIKNRIPPVRSVIHLSKKERMHRVFVKGLSELGSVDKRIFLKEFGESPEDYFLNIINCLKNKKLLQVNDKEIRLSYLGKFLCADVCSNFF